MWYILNFRPGWPMSYPGGTFGLENLMFPLDVCASGKILEFENSLIFWRDKLSDKKHFETLYFTFQTVC